MTSTNSSVLGLLVCINIIISSSCNTPKMKTSIEGIDNIIHHLTLESFNFQSSTKNELLTHFGLSNARTLHLGRTRQPYDYYLWKNKNCTVILWFDKEKLIKVDIDRYANTPQNEVILAQLGEPILKLDFYSSFLLREEMAFVYPEKGISIEFYQVPNEIETISYFEPTTAQFYINNLHDYSIPREFPMYPSNEELK